MADLFGHSAASRAASLFSRADPPEEDDIPGVFAMSIRVPVRMAATVTAMAEHAGLSRNAMVELILQAGIDAVYAATPTEIQHELNDTIGNSIENFL